MSWWQTKVGQSKTSSAANQAKQLGWKAIMAHAITTSLTGASGGLAALPVGALALSSMKEWWMECGIVLAPWHAVGRKVARGVNRRGGVVFGSVSPCVERCSFLKGDSRPAGAARVSVGRASTLRRVVIGAWSGLGLVAEGVGASVGRALRGGAASLLSVGCCRESAAVERFYLAFGGAELGARTNGGGGLRAAVTLRWSRFWRSALL